MTLFWLAFDLQIKALKNTSLGLNHYITVINKIRIMPSFLVYQYESTVDLLRIIPESSPKDDHEWMNCRSNELAVSDEAKVLFHCSINWKHTYYCFVFLLFLVRNYFSLIDYIVHISAERIIKLQYYKARGVGQLGFIISESSQTSKNFRKNFEHNE